MTRMRSQLVFVLGIVGYVFAPGHSGVPGHGAPIGLFVAAALALVTFAAVLWWTVDVSGTRFRAIAIAICACAVLKVAIGLAAPASGWLAAQYANDVLQPPIRRSTQFAIAGATRIDPAIRFRNDRFPVYFLNDADFNGGDHREETEPFSIKWIGHVHQPTQGTVRLSLTVRGALAAVVDNLPAAAATSSGTSISHTEAVVPLSAGPHVFEIEFRKPANIGGVVEVSMLDPSGDVVPVTPFPVSAARRMAGRLLIYPAWALHGVVVALTLVALTILYRIRPLTWRSSDDAVDLPVYLALFAMFSVQGVIRSVPFVGRTWRLTGGDDWLAYEAAARDVATNSILMTFGKPIGAGAPYFYYPLYSYFIALVHKLISEDLSGVIFVQFLILAVTAIIVHRTAKMLFGRTVALWALVVLVMQMQLDFVRYYTVTLLSENLYVLPVALTVYSLVWFAQTRSLAAAIVGGLSGGAAALVRPQMMMFLLPSVALVTILARRPGARAMETLRLTFIYAAAVLAVVLLATIRNYVVSGRLVLLTTGQEWTLVEYNLPSTPDAAKYARAWTGTMTSAAWILWRIFVEHPAEYLNTVFTKVMFSLGLLQWMGQRAHPELVLPSAGYLLAVIFIPQARRLAAWPAHLFVVTHLAGLTLTMPGSYGYRLLLPNYLFFSIFAAAFGVRALDAGRAFRAVRRT